MVDKYGADALRLYLINSPVVRAETLRFKEEGVFAVVKDVFLPWYNAYRCVGRRGCAVCCCDVVKGKSLAQRVQVRPQATPCAMPDMPSSGAVMDSGFHLGHHR